LSSIITKYPLTETRDIVIGGAFALMGAAIFTLMVLTVPAKVQYIIVFSVLPILFLSSLNFLYTVTALVVILFLNIHIGYFSSAVLFVPVVVISFFFTCRNIKWNDVSNPLTKYLLIYTVSVIPSLYNLNTVTGPFLFSLNYIALVSLFYILTVAMTDKSIVARIFTVFTGMVMLNALHVIILSAITKKREFGFAGIMFVDYIGIAFTMMLPLLLRSSRKKQHWLLAMIIMFGIAEMLTQTRGIWLATGIASGIVVLLVYFRQEFFRISRSSIAKFVFIAVLGAVLLYVIVLVINPGVASRTKQIGQFQTEAFVELGVIDNSLVTRLLIWHTAFQGFQAHPITGIGFYSFQFSSQLYKTISPLLYNRYVKSLTPHETFVAVLTETGLLGFIGFSVLLFGMYRIAVSNFSLCETENQKTYALVLFAGLVYIGCSMLITDAWLWGQGIVLWGLVLASVVSFSKYKHTID